MKKKSWKGLANWYCTWFISSTLLLCEWTTWIDGWHGWMRWFWPADKGPLREFVSWNGIQSAFNENGKPLDTSAHLLHTTLSKWDAYLPNTHHHHLITVTHVFNLIDKCWQMGLKLLTKQINSKSDKCMGIIIIFSSRFIDPTLYGLVNWHGYTYFNHIYWHKIPI